jgi:predicted ribosomally synthesized peptide with nif11-like leader
MGENSLSAFMKKLTEDESLQEELRAAARGIGDEASVSVERLVEIARARGFELTAEEVLGLFQVGDEELEAVAGGLTLGGQQERYYKEQRAVKDLKVFKFYKELPLGRLFANPAIKHIK